MLSVRNLEPPRGRENTEYFMEVLFSYLIAPGNPGRAGECGQRGLQRRIDYPPLLPHNSS